LKPGICTFFAFVICLTSVVVYGQSDLPVYNNDGPVIPASTSERSNSQLQISKIEVNSFGAPLIENEVGFQEIQDGVVSSYLTYYENDGVLPIDNDLSLSGIPGTNLISASVHLYYNFKPDQDSLVFEDQNGITGFYIPEEGKMELSGEASFEDYQHALASVGYINTSENPSTDQRRVNFYANNGESIINFERTYIDAVQVNDPPVISGSETVLLYYPGSGAVEVDTMISIIDVDDTILWEGRVWITKNYKPTEDLIEVAEQFGLTLAYYEETATLKILGPATIEQYETIMSAVTYTNTNPHPEPSTRDVSLKVFDEDVRSNIIKRKIEILPYNSPPQIVDINDIPADTLTIEVFEEISTEICVRAIDPDNDTTKVVEVVSLTDYNIVDNSDINDMCFIYTPDKDFRGIDTVKVVVCDTGIPSMCDSAILIIQVEPDPDISPFVKDTDGSRIDTLYYETDEDVTLDFCLEINNPNDNNLIVSQITPTRENTGHGTMAQTDEVAVCLSYTPDENYFGQSSWIVQICNDSNPPVCDSVVIVIDVLPVNDAPVAVNDTVTAIKSSTLSSSVTENDYDIEGDNLIVNEMPETNPLHGTLNLNEDGSFEYTADPGYTGGDGFTYVVCDDGDPSLCSSAEVIITVEDVPLKVYNAVSPNGDALNDFLYIEGIEYYPNNLLSIYDRYNNLVYETFGYNNNNNTWEGQANNGMSTRDLSGETYFYILNPGDGTPLLKGFIMLKKD
jgi:gliding motility-associated-like protein